MQVVGEMWSLLAAAIRKVQQQCYLPPGIHNQDLESFRATLRVAHDFLAIGRNVAEHNSFVVWFQLGWFMACQAVLRTVELTGSIYAVLTSS